MLEYLETFFTWSHAFGSAFSLACLWFMLLLLVWVAAFLWKIVDEKEVIDRNYLVTWIMKLYGYVELDRDSDNAYGNPETFKKSNGERAIFMPLWLTTAPLVMMFVYQFFMPVMWASIAISVLFIARWVRRLTKLLKKHTENKKIHRME